MDLRNEILREHSKAQCLRIVDFVGSSQKKFDILFNLFINDEAIVMQRAGWPALYSVRAHPTLILSHVRQLVDYLKQEDLHQGCRRNGFSIIDSISIPETYHGEIMDLCFRCFESVAESIAAKACILSILTKFTKLYPEIRDEIKLLIQYQPKPLPVAIRSRVKEFEKLIKA